MRALSLRSVTAVLEAPLRNGGQLMDWAYVLLHRPDDCGVAMNSNFFPSYHPQDAKFGQLGRPDSREAARRDNAHTEVQGRDRELLMQWWREIHGDAWPNPEPRGLRTAPRDEALRVELTKLGSDLGPGEADPQS